MSSKALLFALALVSMDMQAISTATTDTLIARAERSYAQGDHATALVFFDSVHTRYSSPALLYDIGNCHFKLNDIPRAILFYERALRLAPGDEDIRTNLELARQQVVDRVNELPQFTLGATWAGLRGGKDPDQWARRSLWAMFVLFTLLALAVVTRNKAVRRTLYVCGAAMGLATIIAVAFAAYRNKEVTQNRDAIILSAKVDVLSEPKLGSTTLFVLHKGTKVTILDEKGGWYEVKLASGSVGWAPLASAERI